MNTLSKKQLEDLGFVVIEKELKKGKKIEIYHNGGHSDYIGEFYDYPTFWDIIQNVVRNVREETETEIKNRFVANLLG